MLIKPISMLRADTVGGGGSGPTFVSKTSNFVPHNAADTQALSHTMASTSNVLIAMVSFESGGTSFDSSINTGGGNIPTFNSVAMTVARVANNSRRHVGIYGIHPNATGSLSFSINPLNGIRGYAVRLEEWSGVDTTTIFNANGAGSGSAATVASTLTTVDAEGHIVGVSCFGPEGTPITVTTPAETINEEGASGGVSQDIRAGWHDVAVTSAAATEGITFGQTGNTGAVVAIAELNPA